MKQQASLNLFIVDDPIDSKALEGHLMLRATSSGLKVYDAAGSETELGGGGGGEITWDAITGKPESFTPSTHTHAISDITSLQTTLDNKVVKGNNNSLGSTSFGLQTSTGTISFTTTSGAISLGTVSGGIHLASFESGLELDGTDVLLSGGGIQFNSHALNTASGLVQLDSNGRLPAVDGSQLTNLPAATVDLTNYSTSTIHLTSTDGDVKLTTGNGNGSIQLTVTDDGNPDRATFKTPGVWDIQLDSYLTKISGTQQMDIEADGSACPVKITAGSNGGDIELNASGSIKFNGADLNTANGLVKLGSDGKIPTSLYEAGGTVDLTNYVGTGNVSLTTGKESLLTLKADTMMEGFESTFKLGTGANADGGNGAYLELNGGSFGVTGYGAYFGSSNSQMSIFQINAQTLMYNNAEQNRPNGLVVLGQDGKIPTGLYDVGSGGDTSALEERVTTLEGTVGTLDAAVDEILADYGEGSGALVYRVVASATEPENPTEGMIWIQTE